MNKFVTLAAMLVICVLLSVAPTTAQNPLVSRPGSHGFKPVATQSLTIATATPTIIGAMPAGCRDVFVVASGATMFYGDENVTTDGLYPSIKDGEMAHFENISIRNPTIYFRALATATGKIGITAK